ncbi:membrane metallo-endopeptidase-like 1 [Elysia marginata]|uniref:Membrane metallo-endopeptidase-like 1 n=1 Tax=Elysia marginata TaxID=1093978 RepID=A0AAV4J1M7_9GAST|nr:membrane metallo-endopeptidase-like 1 [Elysia marginata]
MDMVPELATPFQQAMTEYKAVLQGMKREQLRWKKCVEFVNERVGMAVGAMFVKKNFKKESRDTASDMIHDIREAFNELLEENEWMDDKTRAFAKEKVGGVYIVGRIRGLDG